MITREPSVAGQFYPASKIELIKDIEKLIDKEAAKKEAIAAIMPHAGYIYSGKVAAVTASQIKPKDTLIIIGPNHTGLGAQFSIMTEGSWRTPLGDVNIDSKLANAILENSSRLEKDTAAHRNEHSIEVQLPFLQYFRNDFKLVPIIVYPGQKQIYQELASSIVTAINKVSDKTKVLLVASSDMTHYEAQEEAEKKDREAIKAMLKLDEDALLKKVAELDISMCGYAPAAIVIAVAKQLGAKKAELIKYQTSGDTTGDYSAVVGYAGIIIS